MRILDEAPFESEKRYAAVVYKNANAPRLVVKGAVEIVMHFCARMMTAEGEEPLDRDKILQLAQQKAENGYRVLALAIFLQFPVPLIAVQILWLNLVTNGIQDVALAFEAGEAGVMRQPPRKPSEGIFNPKMIEQLLISGLTMALVCLGVWVFLVRQGYAEDTYGNAVQPS